jgi:hypothetical protein
MAQQRGRLLLGASIRAASASHPLRHGNLRSMQGRRRGLPARMARDAVRGATTVGILNPADEVSDEFAVRLAAWLASVAMNTEGAA